MHEIPSKFPSQMINSSENQKKKVRLAAWKWNEASFEQRYVMNNGAISISVGRTAVR